MNGWKSEFTTHVGNASFASHRRPMRQDAIEAIQKALAVWPYGVQEFDRILVELLNVRPTHVQEARKLASWRSLGCYDSRVKNRYPHIWWELT